MIITVQRQRRTSNGILGILTMDINSFKCFTIENLVKAIPIGTYDLNFTYSNRFKSLMPHIVVPSRDLMAGGDAGIRIHSANYPEQLEGCIAVGNKQGYNDVSDSKKTFKKLFEIIQIQPKIKVTILDY